MALASLVPNLKKKQSAVKPGLPGAPPMMGAPMGIQQRLPSVGPSFGRGPMMNNPRKLRPWGR